MDTEQGDSQLPRGINISKQMQNAKWTAVEGVEEKFRAKWHLTYFTAVSCIAPNLALGAVGWHLHLLVGQKFLEQFAIS